MKSRSKWLTYIGPLANGHKRGKPFVYRFLPGRVAEVALTRGKTTLVDAKDLRRVREYSWCAHATSNRSLYATTNKPGGKHGEIYRLHHVLLGSQKRGLPTVVDHINLNSLDNRRRNLRVVGDKENTRNCRKTVGTTMKISSRFKGVHWDTRRGNWKAQIGVDWKNKYLGTFRSEFQAAKAYDRAAKKYFGPFAKTNADLGLYKNVA